MATVTDAIHARRPAAAGDASPAPADGRRGELLGDLAVYLVINAVLWIGWLAAGAGYAWPAWVSGAWAVVLVGDAWLLYRPGTARRWWHRRPAA